jgi:ElaB/YqjD/DUF883 family membrane-anchored ribosome-binding protein
VTPRAAPDAKEIPQMSPTDATSSTTASTASAASAQSTLGSSQATSGQAGSALKDSLGEAGSHLKQAARDAGEALKGAAGAAGEELRLGRAHVKSDLADGALAGLTAAEQASLAAREQADQLMEKGRDMIDSAAELIRERPIASFGAAFAAGWIIAKLARGSDRYAAVQHHPAPGDVPPSSGPADPHDHDTPPPDLIEALRQIGATGRASLGASVDSVKALRSLVVADIALARSAMGRSMALGGVAIAAGASAWLLLMSTLVVFLSRQVGLSWSMAMLLPAVLSLVVAAVAGWQAMRYFEHTRLQATRRQLARLGIGELADFMPDPDSPESTREAARQRVPTDAGGGPVKDERGVDVTPP